MKQMSRMKLVSDNEESGSSQDVADGETQFIPQEGDDDNLWDVEKILDEHRGNYKLRWKGVWGRRRGQRVGDRMVVIETGAAKVGLARGRALLSASSAPAALPSPRSNLLRSNHASYPSVTCSPPLPTSPSVSPFPLNCPSRHLHSFHHPTVRCFSRRRFKDDLCSPSLSGAGGPDTPRRWPCL